MDIYMLILARCFLQRKCNQHLSYWCQVLYPANRYKRQVKGKFTTHSNDKTANKDLDMWWSKILRRTIDLNFSILQTFENACTKSRIWQFLSIRFWSVLLFDFAMWLWTFQIDFPLSSVFLWFYFFFKEKIVMTCNFSLRTTREYFFRELFS